MMDGGYKNDSVKCLVFGEILKADADKFNSIPILNGACFFYTMLIRINSNNSLCSIIKEQGKRSVTTAHVQNGATTCYFLLHPRIISRIVIPVHNYHHKSQFA